MTQRLDCPMDGCHASFEGETEDEIMTQAEEHAKESHPNLDLDEETVQDLRSKIRTV